MNTHRLFLLIVALLHDCGEATITAASNRATISGAFIPCQSGPGRRVRHLQHPRFTNFYLPIPGAVQERNSNNLHYTCKSIAFHTKARKAFGNLNRRLVLLARQMKRIFNPGNILQFICLFCSLVFLFLAPLKSNASNLGSTSATSSQPSSIEYYLQNNPSRSSSSKTQQRVISIQTQPSTLSSSPSRRGKLSNQRPQRQTTQRIALGLVAASLAAGSFRASLRKSKVVRTATPFGRIRNTSPLGNGVSVIRLRMALELDANDAGGLLEKMQVEEYNLYATISLLAQQQQLMGADVYENRQKALVNYISNVASILNSNKQFIKYGSMVSVRVPFVEEAVNEFRSISKQERLYFDKSRKQLSSTENESKWIRQNEPTIDEKQLVVASIILTIKGDHTSSPFQSGVSTKRDMGRALVRIATDSVVDGCLVGAEVMWMPRELNSGHILKESDVLKDFSDIGRLS